MCPDSNFCSGAGNISAGKSTLCKSLADGLGYTLYLEPTIENPFLVKYYKYVWDVLRLHVYFRAVNSSQLPPTVVSVCGVRVRVWQGADEIRPAHAVLVAEAALYYIHISDPRHRAWALIIRRRHLGSIGS